MRKIFLIALAALLLLAGCGRPGDIAAPPTTTPIHTTAAPAPATTAPAPPPRSYKGIAEGDVLPGELTFYCECAKCNGADCAGVTADGTALADLGPEDYSVAGANWLPLQSLVEVDGTVYRIADRGGPGLNRVGRLDIFTPEGHAAALALGRVKGMEVRVVALPGG
jgi:predicted small lipoprotein YifL/3D (Asp-Asp-Asp) domain-containing protein